VIRPSRYGAPAAQTLVAAAQADLAARYGSGDETSIEAVQFDPPEGAFLVVFLRGEPVACGGWRTLSHFTDAGVAEDVAEIKRMYAAPSVRGDGTAQALLAALEESARDSGMHRMVLETGGRNLEAVRFYQKCGYTPIANYGHYRDEADCVSFGRDL
jgi:GNAT superfamily N-acetyltransferase